MIAVRPPEARGRGIGRALMTELLSAMAERGYPLCLLYPAALRLYQAFGFEHAGGFCEAEIPARALTSLLAPDPEIVVNDSPAGRAGAGLVRGGGARGARLRRLVRGSADGDVAGGRPGR